MNPAAPLKSNKRRKAIIYGGVAAALLLVFLLTRRSSASSSTGATDTTATPQPVSNPAVDPSSYYTGDTGSGAGGVDYSTELASIDSNVNTLAGAVSALQTSSQTPGTSTPGTGGGVDATSIISAFTAGASAFQAGAASAAPAPVTAPAQPGPGSRPPVKPPPLVRLPPPPKSGGHYVDVNNKAVLIHAVGKNKWAPGPPPKRK